jgi:fibronectin type 3 domain-containing protein
MSTRILAALLFSPLLFSCGDEGTISYKEKMPPAVPVNLEAVAGSQQIILTWDKVGNASSYRIYWNTQEITENLKQITDAEGDPNTSITVQTIKDNVTNPYVHTSLTPGTKYHYRVAAFNQAGSKGLSEKEASAIPTP